MQQHSQDSRQQQTNPFTGIGTNPHANQQPAPERPQATAQTAPRQQAQTEFQQTQPQQAASQADQYSQQQQQQQQNQQRRSAFQESEVIPGQFKRVPEEDLMLWNAPSRPFKQRDRQFFVTIVTIVLLISLILFFAGQVLPIAVVISVAFLGYVLSVVPPENVTYKLTTYGVRIEDELYRWDELGRFWYETRYDQQLLKIEVARFPSRLTIVLGEALQDDITAILSEVLPQEKPDDSAIERAGNWLQEKIPLEP